MRVLVSGMTSQHVNPTSHWRSRNFMGLVVDQLSRVDGLSVDWRGCSVLDAPKTYSEYDKVIIGLAPFQALGANRVYGALAAIGPLWDTEKLILVVDQPDPGLIDRGLRSTLSTEGSFTKPFYRYRHEYSLVNEDLSLRLDLMDAMEYLLFRQWPTTLVPALPWTDVRAIEAKLPDGAAGRVFPVNPDQGLLDEIDLSGEALDSARSPVWVHEKHADYKWLQSRNLANPREPLPVNHRIEIESAVHEALLTSAGFLHAPVGGGFWWTPRIATSLALGTPVFTDWERAQGLDPVWGILPSTFESYPERDRRVVAEKQLLSYRQSISTMYNVDNSIIGLRPGEERSTQ